MFNVICIDEEKLNIFYEIKGVSIYEINEIRKNNKSGWTEFELTFILQQLVKMVLAFSNNNLLNC